MKFSFKYILFFSGLLIFSACGNEFDVADNYDLEELPGYVSFGDGSTNNATIDDVATDEAGSATFIIEAPTGTLSDVTINYELSGSAVEGVNYTIDGASGTSGTIVLAVDPDDFQNRDQVELVVNMMSDGVYSKDPLDLTITLVSASNAEGSLAVGRGGTDFLKSANATIANTDCYPDFSGDYTYITTEYFCKDMGDPDLTGSGTFANTADGQYSFDDWTFGVATACGVVVATPPSSFNFCAFADSYSVSGGADFANYGITSLTISGASMAISYGNDDEAMMGTTVITRTDGQDWPADLIE